MDRPRQPPRLGPGGRETLDGDADESLRRAIPLGEATARPQRKHPPTEWWQTSEFIGQKWYGTQKWACAASVSHTN